jgi:hypothetical protein
MIKASIIRTVVPAVISFAIGMLIAYGSLQTIKERKLENAVKEHIEENYNINSEEGK